MYYNISKTLSHDCLFNFIVCNRGRNQIRNQNERS